MGRQGTKNNHKIYYVFYSERQTDKQTGLPAAIKNLDLKETENVIEGKRRILKTWRMVVNCVDSRCWQYKVAISLAHTISRNVFVVATKTTQWMRRIEENGARKKIWKREEKNESEKRKSWQIRNWKASVFVLRVYVRTRTSSPYYFSLKAAWLVTSCCCSGSILLFSFLFFLLNNKMDLFLFEWQPSARICLRVRSTVFANISFLQ